MKSLLTVKHVAGKLKVHPSTVRAMIRDGKLAEHRLGRRTIRIPPESLDALLAKSAGGKDASKEEERVVIRRAFPRRSS
jgi:excisionase family DNA binding protein